MGIMNPGKLNRRLTIQERTLSADSAGGRLETWVDSFDCWGELVINKAKVATLSDAERGEETTTFRVRHKSGISVSNHRILYGLKFYSITGIIEEGIKNTMLLECRTIQSLTT